MSTYYYLRCVTCSVARSGPDELDADVRNPRALKRVWSLRHDIAAIPPTVLDIMSDITIETDSDAFMLSRDGRRIFDWVLEHASHDVCIRDEYGRVWIDPNP